MKTFLLRSVYLGSGIMIKADRGFQLRDGIIQFKRSTSIIMSEAHPVGRGSDHKIAVNYASREVTIHGTPFLVEVQTSGEYEDGANWWRVRLALSAKAEQLAGLLSFAYPGTIRSFAADMLLSKPEDRQTDDWDWTDVSKVLVAPPIEDLVTL